MLRIRLFDHSDNDYRAIVDCWNSNFSDVLETVEQMRHQDENRESHRYHNRVIGELDGEIVAAGVYCETWWQKREGKHFIELYTKPQHQDKGFGKAMYDWILAQMSDRKLTMLASYTRDDQARGMRFLEDRGYKLAIREPASRLDLTQFEGAPFAETIKRVAESGITIEPLDVLMEKVEDWQRLLFDMRWLAIKDIPGTDPWEQEPIEEWIRETLENPEFVPAGHFIALDGEKWVGLSNLWPTKADPDKRWYGLTGVVPDYRRRGIAGALKVRAAEYARDRGYKIVDTDNEENNPMYGINMKLGFKPLPAWLGYERKLEE